VDPGEENAVPSTFGQVKLENDQVRDRKCFMETATIRKFNLNNLEYNPVTENEAGVDGSGGTYTNI